MIACIRNPAELIVPISRTNTSRPFRSLSLITRTATRGHRPSWTRRTLHKAWPRRQLVNPAATNWWMPPSECQHDTLRAQLLRQMAHQMWNGGVEKVADSGRQVDSRDLRSREGPTPEPTG